MQYLDFSISRAVFIALLIGIFLPVYLLLIVRAGFLRGRNARQFAVSFAVMMVLWLWVIATFPGKLETSELVLSLMVLLSAALFYLEVWAILSRGYTLGLLLTLLRSGKPLTENELAAEYRGGDGLDWIMRHRLSGLAAAKLVTISNRRIKLTLPGVLIARLYRISIIMLGLGKTG